MASATAWRNRIIRSGDAALSEIEANPGNWRTHPEAQRAALSGVLETVGFVQQVVINERSGRLVDGHLRVALAARHGDPSVPAVWVDLDDDEERLILATLDPLGALAETDAEQLRALLADVVTDDEAVQALLANLVGTVTPAEIIAPTEFPEYGDDIETQYTCPSCHYCWSGQPKPAAS